MELRVDPLQGVDFGEIVPHDVGMGRIVDQEILMVVPPE